MSVGSVDAPGKFVELVRDALLGLYDPSALQASPLLTVVDRESGTVATIQRFRQALLNAIELFHPKPGVASTARAWRIYRILELRYIERHEVSYVIEQIALSKSQYHREHNYALQAVARVLWNEWQIDEGWIAREAERMTPARAESDLLENEVGTLRQSDGTARTDPAEVLCGIGDLLRPLCTRRGIQLRFEISDHLPAITGDRVALRQALLPILIQAINGAGHAGVEVVAARRERQIEISVSGLAPTFRADSRLVITESQPFIAALGGTLTFAVPSRSCDGGTVTLSLPASDCSTLLVVDNNADFTQLVARYLAGHPWEVVGAADVDRAYGIAESCHPRAVLLDVVLPGRDGWDLLSTMKRSSATQDIPVVICSVLDEPEVALALGATAYLRKPIDRQHLIETLGRFV